jgi:hypothetical protein
MVVIEQLRQLREKKIERIHSPKITLQDFVQTLIFHTLPTHIVLDWKRVNLMYRNLEWKYNNKVDVLIISFVKKKKWSLTQVKNYTWRIKRWFRRLEVTDLENSLERCITVVMSSSELAYSLEKNNIWNETLENNGRGKLIEEE